MKNASRTLPFLLVLLVLIVAQVDRKSYKKGHQTQNRLIAERSFEFSREAGVLLATPCSSQLLAKALRGGRRAQCAHLSLLESQRSRRLVRLGLVRLPPREDSKEFPLVVLAGGPGDSFIVGLPERLRYLLPMAKGRELILLDARGVGTSVPSLDCPGSVMDGPAIARCFAGWDAEIDLDTYTTQTSVEDLRLILRVLKLQSVFLLGVSSSTKIARQFTETYPDSVEALILDSPIARRVPLLKLVESNEQAALRTILQDCAQEDLCHHLLSDMRAPFKDIALMLEQNTLQGMPRGADFLRDLASMMRAPSVLPLVPFLVSQALKGEFSLFNRLATGLSNHVFSLGAHLSVQCAELEWQEEENASLGVGRNAREEPFHQATAARDYLNSCRIWKVKQRTEPQGEIRRGVRVLVLSGRYDPVTPLRYGVLVAQRIVGSSHMIFGGQSHGVAFSSLGAEAVVKFVEGGKKVIVKEGGEKKIRDWSFLIKKPSPNEIEEMIHELRYRL